MLCQILIFCNGLLVLFVAVMMCLYRREIMKAADIGRGLYATLATPGNKRGRERQLGSQLGGLLSAEAAPTPPLPKKSGGVSPASGGIRFRK